LAEYIYEGLFILNSNRYGRDPEGVAGSIQALIEKREGTVLVSRLWEERRLAYPINGQRKGTYWLTYFRMDGEKIADLNQQAHREDDLLRHLVIRIDPRIADTLISHAQQTVRQSTSDAAKKANDQAKEKQGDTADVSVATVEAE
jgi:small subunit ribosomal protein S6